MIRQKKEEIVAELRETMVGSPSVIITSIVGVDANRVNELRSKLRAGGVTYKVVKNTLARRAIAGTEMEILHDSFVGPTAIAYSPEDPVSPAKILKEFAKDEDKLVIRGGYLGGELLDTAGVDRLAEMPGKDELRAKLLSVFNGVATQLVRVMSAAQRDFLGVVNARKAELDG